MNKILRKEKLAENLTLIEVEAPLICQKAQPGQFIVLRVAAKGERIPLTIADKNPKQGTITIIFQEVGATTYLLGQMKTGESLVDLLGPLGKASEIKKYGTVVAIGGGVGIAELYPAVQALKEAGNRVITIIGARSKKLIIFEDKLRSVSDELFITTDDGSYGRKGFVSDILKQLLEQGAEPEAKRLGSDAKEPRRSVSGSFPDYLLAVGPVPMMKVVSDITRPFKIKTVVSLNPLMLDATGMCGICRVTVAGKTRFACVDGPEFDGHEVDFDELQLRLNMYRDVERQALNHVCRLMTNNQIRMTK